MELLVGAVDSHVHCAPHINRRTVTLFDAVRHASAAGLRLVLPRKDAGMLAVRHRLVDVLLLGSVAALLWFLAVTIPNPPGL